MPRSNSTLIDSAMPGHRDPRSRVIKSRSKLSEFAISLDEGPAEFGTIDGSKTSGRMTTKQNSFEMYSFDVDSASKRCRTTQFVDKDTQLIVRSERRSLGS